jgi:hypothetical protein
MSLLWTLASGPADPARPICARRRHPRVMQSFAQRAGWPSGGPRFPYLDQWRHPRSQRYGKRWSLAANGLPLGKMPGPGAITP